MKFNIVENPTPKYVDRYDDFIKMYNSGVRVKTIQRELEWSQNTYRQAKRKALEAGLIKDRVRNGGRPRYYHKYYSMWLVEREVDGRKIRTQCRTEEEAKNIVRFLEKHGWSKENIMKWKRGVV